MNGSYATPATIDYSTVTPTDKKITTVSAPTSQATITNFTQVTGNSLKINWTNGNGKGRLVVAKKGNSLTAIPQDLKSYAASSAFAVYTSSDYVLDAETFAVYKTGAQTSADITSLEPNTVYTFAIYEFNGNQSPVYLTTTVTQSITTSAGPTIGTGAIGIGSLQGNSIEISCSRGNGAKRIIIAKKGSTVTSIPVNGTSYMANSIFGTPAAEIVPGLGEYVVYTGTSNGVTITNLELFTTYHFAIYEFDQDANGYTYYLTGPQSSTLPSRKSQSTLLPPTANTTLTVSNITGSSAKLTYVFPASGYGTYRMLVIREGTPTDFLPEDLKTYTGSVNYKYGTGQLVGTDSYVLVAGSNGGAPTVTGLAPGHTYYVTVFDHNGTNGPVYLRPGSSAAITVPNEPTTAPKDPTYVTVDGNLIRFDWTNGDGARRIVVARKNTAVTSLPQDGTVYTPSASFGTLSSEIVQGSGEFVVYDGIGNSVNITGLEKATTYHFAVFEYNLNGVSPDYLTASGMWLAASKATVAAPATQVSNLSASAILSDRATINFTVGNGSSRVFVMREGAPVSVEPTDFTTYYLGTTSFGVASGLIGTDTYVVSYGNVSSFTVTGLKAGTPYCITAFEYNGSSAPVYLRPGATPYNFTTAGGVVITAPTQTSHTPLFESVDGNKFTFKWTSGDGANRIVVARKGSAVNFVPADGASYAADASFGSNTDLGQGQYVVCNGNSSTVELANLEPNTTYHFAVFEYNGSGGTIKYGSSALSVSHSTAAPPTIKCSNAVSSIGANSITLSWTKGNGEGRIVVAKEGSEIAAAPSNLSKYSANNVFKNGPQLAIGEYVVYAGAGNSVTVTGLEANKTYHFSVFEYNGINAPVYNTTDVLKTSANLSSALPVTWLYVNAKEKNNASVIEWATAQEINNDYFLVQRSTDGIHYSDIARVKAYGNSYTNRDYAYTDGNAGGVTYYRIQQVDMDGKKSYSKVVKVMVAGPDKVQLLPNPVHNNLRMKCTEEQIGGLLIITDASGRVVNKITIIVDLLTIDTSNLTSGVYYLSVQDKNGRILNTQPFVKQ